MHTPASIAKHPMHPMLVAIPIGLWIFSLICDLVLLFGGTSENWAIVARYTMVGGIIGALIAAVPGFIDMLALPAPVKRIALMHLSINLTVVALYVVNFYLRTRGIESSAPVWLSGLRSRRRPSRWARRGDASRHSGPGPTGAWHAHCKCAARQ